MARRVEYMAKEYMADMAGQLAAMADENGQEVLAFIFRMAEQEASLQALAAGTTIVPPYSLMNASASDPSAKHHRT